MDDEGKSLTGKVLIASEDPTLLEELDRIAAGCDVQATAATTLMSMRAQWARAALVIVGHELAEQLDDWVLPRRDGVVVVGRGQRTDAMWRAAVRIGASSVVELPIGERLLADAMLGSVSESTNEGIAVAVVGAAGGVGASCLAAAIAARASVHSQASAVVDLDPVAAGLDVLLGDDHAQGVSWADVCDLSGRVAGHTLSDALPEVNGVRVLSWLGTGSGALPAPAIAATVTALRSVHHRVVVDVPRSSPVAEAALDHCELVVLLVSDDYRSVAAAHRLLSQESWRGRSIELVVRQTRRRHVRVAEIAGHLNVPVLVTMRDDPKVAADLAAALPPGTSRGPLAKTAQAVLDRLEQPLLEQLQGSA